MLAEDQTVPVVAQLQDQTKGDRATDEAGIADEEELPEAHFLLMAEQGEDRDEPDCANEARHYTYHKLHYDERWGPV